MRIAKPRRFAPGRRSMSQARANGSFSRQEGGRRGAKKATRIITPPIPDIQVGSWVKPELSIAAMPIPRPNSRTRAGNLIERPTFAGTRPCHRAVCFAQPSRWMARHQRAHVPDERLDLRDVVIAIVAVGCLVSKVQPCRHALLFELVVGAGLT